jgi:crotonobetainyl-CoA:carnitine CoA-transferase CaiB-like acyl-CoA transferase
MMNGENIMDNKKPLTGVKVIDLTTNIAGPAAAKILADEGADVIKVEPLFGDVYRPLGIVAGAPIAPEETPHYDIENANKKHISLDLKMDKGQEILHKLLTTADILITNYRDEALETLKISYEDLSPKYPRLIYGHLKGYGEKGPEKDRPGYDIVTYWSRTGMLLDTGIAGQIPPINMGGCGDHPTGVTLAQGVTAALVRQMKTGKGDKVSVSLFHCGIYAIGTQFEMAQYKTRYPVPYDQPPIHPAVYPYKCSDGEWVLLMLWDFNKYWVQLCGALGRPDLCGNPKFNTVAEMKKNQPELVDILSKIIVTKTCHEWLEKWQAEDIPCERLRHIIELRTDETALINDFIRPVTYPSGNTVYVPTTPIQFREMGEPDYKTTKGIGADTKEIMLELGYTAAEIEKMKESKAIKYTK